MASSAYGTVFYFTPSGGSRKAVGSLSSIGEIAADSKEIDVTTLDSAGGYRQYIQGYKDAGSLKLEGFLDSGDAGQAALMTAYASGAAGTAEIAFPDGSGAEFSAFVKGYSIGAAEVDGAVRFGAELRITGTVTFSEEE